jgi:hypothetical protein
MANVKSDYFLCRQDHMVEIARHIKSIDLPIVGLIVLCALCLDLSADSPVPPLHPPFRSLINTSYANAL